jgi:hypothetical protein
MAVELAALRGLPLVPPDVGTTYCGLSPHQAAKPENQLCPFPSYAGADIAYTTMPGRLNNSLSTDPTVRIC